MTVASIAAARAEARARTQLVFTSQKLRIADCKYGQELMVKVFQDQIHYDLVEVVWTDHMVAHIPAPFFLDIAGGLKILLHLPHSSRTRDDQYFHCPICGFASYFTGPCRSCGEDYTPETIYTKDKWASWHSHEKKKKARKVHLLGRLRHGHRAPKTVSRMEYVVALPRL